MAQRAATIADVREIAPDLSAATDGQITTALRVTAYLVNPARFRSMASDAHAHRAAHWLATTPGLGLGPAGADLLEPLGLVSAEADGPSSRSFGAAVGGEALPAEDALLTTTPYGRAFLGYRQAARGFGCFLTGGGTFPA